MLFSRRPRGEGLGGGQPKGEIRPSQARESSAESEKNHRDVMLDAIAENMWDLGMTMGVQGSPAERKALTRQMAEQALALVPDNYLTLSAKELQANKHFLVSEAVALYKERQAEEDRDIPLAAK